MRAVLRPGPDGAHVAWGPHDRPRPHRPARARRSGGPGIRRLHPERTVAGRSRHHALAGGCRGRARRRHAAAPGRRSGPDARAPPARAVTGPCAHRGVADRRAPRALGSEGTGHTEFARRTLAAAATGIRAPRSHLHQAGSDHLVGRGHLPRGAGRASSGCCATGCRPSPSPWSGARVEEDLGRPLADVFTSFDRDPDRLGLHRPGARGHAAHRRAGGREGPAAAGWPQLVRLDVAAMAWIAPFLVGRIPVAALTNPPALVELFAETIVEELDFRLEAQNMLDIAAVFAGTGQRTVVVPRPHPELVTRRVLVMERLHGFPWGDAEGMRAAGIDTAAVLAVEPHRLPRGGPALRRVPRRPPRRQPARPAGRHGRPPRLRDHGAARREEAAGVPAARDGGHHEQHGRPGRGPARPRRPSGRLRHRGGHPRPQPRPAARSTRPR